MSHHQHKSKRLIIVFPSISELYKCQVFHCSPFREILPVSLNLSFKYSAIQTIKLVDNAGPHCWTALSFILIVGIKMYTQRNLYVESTYKLRCILVFNSRHNIVKEKNRISRDSDFDSVLFSRSRTGRPLCLRQLAVTHIYNHTDLWLRHEMREFSWHDFHTRWGQKHIFASQFRSTYT